MSTLTNALKCAASELTSVILHATMATTLMEMDAMLLALLSMAGLAQEAHLPLQTHVLTSVEMGF